MSRSSRIGAGFVGSTLAALFLVHLPDALTEWYISIPLGGLALVFIQIARTGSVPMLSARNEAKPS